MPMIKLEIDNMKCNNCKLLIREIMEEVGAEITSFKVDENKKVGHLEVISKRPHKQIIKAISSEGYGVARLD